MKTVKRPAHWAIAALMISLMISACQPAAQAPDTFTAALDGGGGVILGMPASGNGAEEVLLRRTNMATNETIEMGRYSPEGGNFLDSAIACGVEYRYLLTQFGGGAVVGETCLVAQIPDGCAGEMQEGPCEGLPDWAMTICGDGICSGPENPYTCDEDCDIPLPIPTQPPVCGDGTCNGMETTSTCLVDCMTLVPITLVPLPYCGDGVCGATESFATCPEDCALQVVTIPPMIYCGDGICNGSENAISCAVDCPFQVITLVPIAYCGDGVCNGDESFSTCSQDCPLQIYPITLVPLFYCGDGVCNGSESVLNCPADCHFLIVTLQPITYCGDGECEGSESSYNCPQDCGPY